MVREEEETLVRKKKIDGVGPQDQGECMDTALWVSSPGQDFSKFSSNKKKTPLSPSTDLNDF